MSLADLATIEAALAASEAQVPGLRAGCEKRIIWAAAPATRTKTAVVFIHGFSATAEELRPLPDLVAEGLKANLHFTRLTGHGQDGAALGRATLADWRKDVAEALEVGQTIGERVIVIGCSTGCTLATLALVDGAQIAGMVHVSPNFGLAHKVVQTLVDLPFARHWVWLVAGRTRRFPAQSPEHEKYWTLRYPTTAVHTMADAVRAARKADLSRVTTPALFCFNEKDQVVSAEATRAVIARWGGPVDTVDLVQTDEDDAMGHIMAGNIFSPGQTLPLSRRILAWSNRLPTG